MNTDARPAAPEAGESRAGPKSLGWRAWLLIVSVSITVCCFMLGGARALTEHEIYVAGGAKQMALDHDWLVPKVGDHLWLEKPPLLHWLMIVSAGLTGGFSEISARLPSVIAGLGMVVVMTLLALQWFDRRIAVVTGLVQTTMVYFITYARLAEAEMLLAFIVVLGFFLFVRLHSVGDPFPRPDARIAFLFWAVVGLSNMAKGLGFGPALILGPCITFLILKRDSLAWRRTISWPGLVVGSAIAVAWPITVALRVPGARELWSAEIERRATGGAGYHQPWWYYLTTVPWQLLPWTLALAVAVGPSVRRAWRQSDSADRFIWCWAVVPILMLSLFSGKHHHYILSALCAFSPICAIGLLRCGTRATATCIALVVGGILLVHGFILPRYDRSRDDRTFLQSVWHFVPANAPLAATEGREIARHIFYVNPPPLGIWNADDVQKYFSGIPFYLITRRKEEQRLTALGRVEVLTESRHTRNEQSAGDRFTLFRIEPGRISSNTPSLGQ